MEDVQYGRVLKSAILKALGIAEPPYLLKVETNVGSVSLELFDAETKSRHDLGDGVPIWSTELREGLLDHEIPTTSHLIADEIRPHLESHERKNRIR